jgi:hypothetical protein
MSPAKRLDTTLVIGGSPRADLLPPEIKADARTKDQRRNIVAIAVGATVLVVAGYVFSVFAVGSSAMGLTAANDRTIALLGEQTKYSEISVLDSQVATATEARQIGTSTEIDWDTYLGGLQATLPAGFTVQTVTVTSATPLTVFSVPGNPLEGERMAEIVFAVTAKALPDVSVWLDNLAEIPGFVDAYPTGIVLNDAGDYTLGMTIHIDTGALTNRFTPTEDDAK